MTIDDTKMTEPMSKEEMIDTLKGLVFGTFDRTTAKEREALDIAIKALEQEPCEDCVSRAKAIEICKSRGHDNSAHYISELPSVTPQRSRGKWIDRNCSICGYGVNSWNKTPYCPNCGSDMRESEEEE